MAEKFVSLAPVGVVTAIVGEVRVTSLDGTTRLLAAGDTVSTGDVVETSANGAVHIQLANGRSVDCGEQFSLKVSENLLDLPSGTRIALDGTVSSPAATADAAPGNTIFPNNTAGSSAPQDIAALQAQIAAGADPSRIAEATAAGGAPGAGGAEAGGSHEPVILEQADTRGTIQSGFTTGAPNSLSFPSPSPQQAVILPATPAALTTPAPATSIPPVISVDLAGVRLAPPPGENPTGPAENVTVSGNIVSLIEGTSGGTDSGKILNFVLTLDKPATADVVVTYQVSALGSETDTDLVDLMGGTDHDPRQ